MISTARLGYQTKKLDIFRKIPYQEWFDISKSTILKKIIIFVPSSWVGEGRERGMEPVPSLEKWWRVLFSRLFLLFSDFWSWADGINCLSWLSSHKHYLHLLLAKDNLSLSLLFLSPADMCLECYAFFFWRILSIWF